METINCIICGSNKNSPFFEVTDRLSQNSEFFHLVKCECEFVYLNPRPIESQISKYYSSPKYDPHNSTKENMWGKIYKLVQWWTLRWKFKKISSLHSSGNLLDIGGGNGEFAHFMSVKGWNVVIQDKFSNIEHLMGSKIINKLENLKLFQKTEYFNVITLWHSLEHIHEIDKLFFHLNRLLKSDGILLIAVPNLNAPERIFFNKNWAPFDAPRHLYHFQLKTLNKLCSKYKFKIVRKYSLFQDTPYNILLSITKNNPSQFIKGILVFCYSIIVTLVKGPEHSSSLLVVCRKA